MDKRIVKTELVDIDKSVNYTLCETVVKTVEALGMHYIAATLVA